MHIEGGACVRERHHGADTRDLCGDHERLADTIYPLLRRLEEKGYVQGEERPDTRSRRFYKITRRGEEKYAEIKGRFEVHLLRVREAIESLHRELYG